MYNDDSHSIFMQKYLAFSSSICFIADTDNKASLSRVSECGKQKVIKK